MSLISFLNSGFTSILPILPTVTLEFTNGSKASAVFDSSTHNNQKEFGGFEPKDSTVVTVPTASIPTGTDIGDIVKLDSVEWRINYVKKGLSFTHITVVSKDKS